MLNKYVPVVEYKGMPECGRKWERGGGGSTREY